MIAVLEDLTDHPGLDRSSGPIDRSSHGRLGVDVLSDVLSAVRLTGAIYFDINARAPWVAATPPMSQIGPSVMPGFERVISFHVMLEGKCWAELQDHSEPPVLLESGTGVLFVRGDPHIMSAQPGNRSDPNLDMYYKPQDRT